MTESLLVTQIPLQAQTEMMEGIVRRFAPKSKMQGPFTPQTNLLDARLIAVSSSKAPYTSSTPKLREPLSLAGRPYQGADRITAS